jgi:serine/threonine-protein kinase HipA
VIDLPPTELHVFWAEDHIGLLSARPNGRVRFTYSPEWLAGPAIPVSISLPCQAETHDAEVSTIFFENYMPEGEIKTELAKARKIASHDIFMFLREFGRDMAGALSLQEEPVMNPASDYEDITARLEDILSKRDRRLPLNLFLKLDANLSLAGGQDKLPVLYRDGRFFLSRGNAPTSHIIKPMHTLFKDLPHNEHYCMSLARNVGLNVLETDIVTLGGEPVYMIKRFDRLERAGRLARLHQEDFCQALSIPAARKYQVKGGPGWPELMKVISENPFKNRDKDLEALIDAAIYNFIIGNTDAHGKNFSILYGQAKSGSLSLAPFYDLCSTYPYGDIVTSKRLAMSIGKKQRFDRVEAENWRQFAEVVDLAREELAEKMTKVAEAVEAGSQVVLEAHKELYARTGVPGTIAEQAGRQAAEVRTMAERLGNNSSAV